MLLLVLALMRLIDGHLRRLSITLKSRILPLRVPMRIRHSRNSNLRDPRASHVAIMVVASYFANSQSAGKGRSEVEPMSSRGAVA
jgi:hypothetical protein